MVLKNMQKRTNLTMENLLQVQKQNLKNLVKILGKTEVNRKIFLKQRLSD